ncbi:hypothetical protein E2C06_04885 [Dankookia rubra]|uniref:Uncharacterized protein n=1 Tax=Dankookia rubra TaxID=1442381 RepID=A0A4R5QJS4_9PROT|nr:hypothetical protein [Dankookia rubra]TDH63664.1 hypothetical protein E2C06_04885 [Dankookia rubra]
MRRAAGRLLLAGGLLAFLGLAGAAVLGLAPFAPFWAFLSCAAAMAGLALRQSEVPEGTDQGPIAGLDGALSDGGGTGAGDSGGDGGGTA